MLHTLFMINDCIIQFQETALHMAVKKAYKEVVELLVQNNADIEKADKVNAQLLIQS